MSKKIILYSLQTFSSTGGIQKMTRTLAHSLHAISEKNGWQFQFWSAYDYDDEVMTRYIPAKNFRGFGINRYSFVFEAIASAKKQDIVILSHVNMAIIGILIKSINPKCHIWLIAHGIEIWRPLSFIKKLLLKHCDKILCVSNFTKQKMIDVHNINPDVCYVLNNAVDPFMKLPVSFNKPDYLLKRYGLTINDPVIFTLTRLSSSELYKGHDHVITVLSKIKKTFPAIKYLLAGKYDNVEKLRIEKLIADNGVEDQVILTGFVKEEELADHFLLANLFILPSKKEGFGIVFIEALACGLQVICGNADGSVDAICNGLLGKAINPDSLEELEKMAIDLLKNPLSESERLHLQKQCLANFDESIYMKKLESLIISETGNNNDIN